MRLDLFLSANGKFSSRTKAAEAIGKGLVLVDGKKAKASAEVDENSRIEIAKAKRFVSNGGYKLDKAFTDFSYDPQGKIFADIGASTGGFTDCLLQRGVAKVYAVDVGENLLDERLKCDRVVVMDHTNARFLTKDSFADILDGAVVDCSFISLRLILNSVKNFLEDGKEIFALIKPQFELEERKRFKNGIIKEVATRKNVVEKIYRYCIDNGFAVRDFTFAPIVEGKNIEYVIRLIKGEKDTKTLENILSRCI